MKWRVIMTDTESPTGVAPICPCDHSSHSESGSESSLESWVFDCCPHPHIETYGEADARTLAAALNAAAGGEGAEICS